MGCPARFSSYGIQSFMACQIHLPYFNLTSDEFYEYIDIYVVYQMKFLNEYGSILEKPGNIETKKDWPQVQHTESPYLLRLTEWHDSKQDSDCYQQPLFWTFQAAEYMQSHTDQTFQSFPYFSNYWPSQSLMWPVPVAWAPSHCTILKTVNHNLHHPQILIGEVLLPCITRYYWNNNPMGPLKHICNDCIYSILHKSTSGLAT